MSLVSALSQLVTAPPLDVLTFNELTPGHSISGFVDYPGLTGYALRINFDSIPGQWGISLGAINVYEPPLASVAFTFNGGIYAFAWVQWGDWLLYPIPPGPVTTFLVDLAIKFAPGISGRIYVGQL